MKNDIMDKFNDLISKYIKNGKINHAYLLETNYIDRLELVNCIINRILSFENNITSDDLLKSGDLIIINEESNLIKLERIDEIKDKFKTKSLLNSKRIYVITEAEKLNNYTSNKLLKFLEEPEDDIISILVTENKKNLLDTIVSRCFNIRFFVNNEKDDLEKESIDKLFDFILNIEENKEQAIAFQNRVNSNSLQDRLYLKDFLNNMLIVYDDVIQYKISSKVNYFLNYVEKIDIISKNNNISDLNKKINVISDCIDRLKYNPNVKLLIDKLIIEMSGVDLNA